VCCEVGSRDSDVTGVVGGRNKERGGEGVEYKKGGGRKRKGRGGGRV
jgi:hypothetical protein